MSRLTTVLAAVLSCCLAASSAVADSHAGDSKHTGWKPSDDYKCTVISVKPGEKYLSCEPAGQSDFNPRKVACWTLNPSESICAAPAPGAFLCMISGASMKTTCKRPESAGETRWFAEAKRAVLANVTRVDINNGISVMQNGIGLIDRSSITCLEPDTRGPNQGTARCMVSHNMAFLAECTVGADKVECRFFED